MAQLAGVRPPTSGRVDVSGADPAGLAPRDLVARVGLVPQDAGLLLYSDSVATECEGVDHDTGLAAGTTAAVLERILPGLPRDRHPRDLSEGQRLALALAVVLAPAPPLLLLDEPTRGLDYPGKARLVRLLDELAADGHAVVMATHDVELVAQVATRGCGAGRRRSRGRRAGPRRGLSVSGLRPPGGQGAGARTVADGRTRSGTYSRRSPSVAEPRRSTSVVRLRSRSSVLLVVTSVVGFVGFAWPLFIHGTSSFAQAHSADAPWIFVAVLPLLLAVVLSALAEGSLDAKAIALLGILAACGAALRIPSPGVAGFEPVFFLLIPAGRVMGRGFGFVLGVLTLAVSALITGGVGPWLPFQMFGAGWLGFGAGCLPPVRGRAEVWLLAGYTAVACLLYGTLLNLYFWPFGAGTNTSFSFVPGAGLFHNLHSLRALRPDHVARLRHPPGPDQRRPRPAARAAGAGRPAAGQPSGGVRCPGRACTGRPGRGRPGPPLSLPADSHVGRRADRHLHSLSTPDALFRHRARWRRRRLCR